jgi:hypothetical protein
MSKKAFLCAMIFAASCGTIVGNGIDPTSPVPDAPAGPSISPADFLRVRDEYKADDRSFDCGSYSENNTAFEIEGGRACIAHAEPSCDPAKYLFDKTNADGSRFVSFVSVAETSPGSGECDVYVHTVSNVPGNVFNDHATCDEFTADLIPELACGIGDYAESH